ncbi:MAG: 50S ribosomal protein L11 methyltransferase [Anaerolineae bacterium]|nr:50S ribosomal protein L11 methyltransferase [Anaerolineae bacterium]
MSNELMYWLEVSVITDGEGAEAVAEKLRPFAYQDGVVLEQLGDMSSLDPDALETAVTVKIYIPEHEDTPRLRRRIEEIIYFLGRLYPIPPPTFRLLAEEDWANAWKAHYHPFRIGQRIWIQPSWIEAETPDAAAQIKPDDVVLTLDPGMAFGTGLHPTTQMCLQALEELVQPGHSIFDLGTGSGILAIAAAKLGAARVLGVDVDEVAVQTAVTNTTLNHLHNLAFQKGTLATVTEKGWDIVVVNILAPVIVGLLENDGLLGYVKPGGHLILSGIIEEQAEDVKTAVTQAGGYIHKTLQMTDWVALIGRLGD